MAIPSSGVHLRDRTKTAPTLRTSASGSSNNGVSTVSVTIPGSAQAGDLAVFVVCESSGTCDTPTGLTKEAQSTIGNTANNPYLHVYTRRLVAGDVASDLGATFTFTASATDGLTVTVQVFANTSGFSVRPTFDSNAQADALNNRDPRVASMPTGPSDLFCGAAGALSYVSAGLAAVTLTTAPTGCTINQTTTATRGAGTAGTCRGLGCWTGPAHAARAETVQFGSNVWAVTVSYALAPLNPHRVDVTRGPSGLEGVPVYNYSNSSGSVVVYSQADTSRGANTYRPWPERVQMALGSLATTRNMAMGGARAADICTAAYGTAVYNSTRAGANNTASSDNQSNQQAVTQMSLPSRLSALYTTDLVGNDFLKLGTDDATMAGAWNAVEALFRLIRAQSAFGVGQGGQTADASFSTVSSDGYMGGSAIKTTTPGGKVTISLTDTDAIDLVLIASDDTALGVVGAPFVVKVDGVTRSTATSLSLTNPGRTVALKGTTSNQHQNSGAYKNYKFCQMTVSLTGIGSGSHTVTIEHAGNSGDQLIYNGYLVPAANPPWIVTNTIWEFPDATYTGAPYGFASAAVGKQIADWFNQIVRQVAGLFPDGRVLVFEPAYTGRFDVSLHVSSGDNLHQSEVGHAYYANEIVRLLNQRLPAPAVSIGTPTALVPTAKPFTLSLTGTRDWTVPTTGSYVLECAGPGGGGGGGATAGAGRGGGHGAYAKKTVTLTAGSVLTLAVAPGGTAGPANTAGSSSTMLTQVTYKSGPDFTANTVLCKADKGLGGGTGLGAVGAGGTAANSVGDLTVTGASGSTSTGGGPGSGDTLGAAGGVYSGSGVGTSGGNPGGGGSGANPGNAGGKGGDGAIRIS
jgi:hypothetical protein